MWGWIKDEVQELLVKDSKKGTEEDYAKPVTSPVQESSYEGWYLWINLYDVVYNYLWIYKTESTVKSCNNM